MMKTHNECARQCHEDNIRWWQNPRTQEPIKRDREELFMLMISELAEAMEGERKNLMDDKLPHRKMAEVELADCLIRIYDWAGAFDLDLDAIMANVQSTDLSTFRGNRAAELLSISRELVNASGTAESRDAWHAWYLGRAIAMIMRYASFHGYDIDGAYEDKRAYNRTRKDHSHEARLAEGGKQF